ncbi:MAG: Gfo/Idh/MocA family oxidoreductase [Candidatus Bathyarchaeia archaeon]
MNRLRVGFVGTGWIVNTHHAKAWRWIRNADITAVCDIKKERAKATAALCQELGIGKPKVYTDASKMARDSEVDAIWITIPNYARIPVVKAIVEEVIQGRADLIGLACEKPLGRNVKEAQQLLEMVEKAGLLHGYLENQVFMPSLLKGKEIIWKRGASLAGRPYLARCAEEHGGPHEAWFWNASLQGGGALNDMLCHSIEASRFMLAAPHEEKLVPRAISAEIAALKWSRKEYADKLMKASRGQIDYLKKPAEDWGRATVIYETSDGLLAITDLFTSWSFVPGERIFIEIIGPEYCMQVDTLNSEMKTFFSREIKVAPGNFIEKQAAEQGFMPVIPDETSLYGYVNENMHMVESFINGKMPRENWNDGLLVVKILMTCYMSAEKGKKLSFPPNGLEDFTPKVVQGTWKPRDIINAQPE